MTGGRGYVAGSGGVYGCRRGRRLFHAQQIVFAGGFDLVHQVIGDPDGIIQYVEITSEGVGRNAAELLRKVKAAIYVRAHPGEVCPAKWEEGEKTLAPSLDLVGKI